MSSHHQDHDWQTETDVSDVDYESLEAIDIPEYDKFSISETTTILRMVSAGKIPIPEARTVFIMKGKGGKDFLLTVADKDSAPTQEVARLRDEAAAARKAMEGGSGATSGKQCGICVDASANAVSIKCGHTYACMICTASLKACPICRVETSFVMLRFAA
jgi:hypothetical protein